jgi:GT2 family glycosyltransferase
VVAERHHAVRRNQLAILQHLHGAEHPVHAFAGEALRDDVLATVAERFASERVDWVFGTVQVLKDGQLIPPYRMVPFSYHAFAAGRASVPHPAVFIRRSAFGRVGMFDEKLKYAMDIDLWLRLGKVARPATIDRPLTVFRDHAGSVSSANKIKARQEEFQVRRRYLKQAPLAFGIYCLRYYKRMRTLRAEAHAGVPVMQS